MTTLARHNSGHLSGYSGLRLTANEFFALADDGARYELIDGVVQLSPGPTPRHQHVALAIVKQLTCHADDRDLGLVLYEIDVVLAQRSDGRDVVYRPEIVFVRKDRVALIEDRIRIVPDVVVEIISPDSRSLDTVTKYQDYERAGVLEYWLIDPPKERMTFYRYRGQNFVEVPPEPGGLYFASEAVAGFRLDLTKIRAAFNEFH